MFLVLPWEVLERVIEHSSDDDETLCSFSLTCRQLHPRSTTVLFTDVRLCSARQVSRFRDALWDNVDLRPFVLSLTVDPRFCDPSPLLPLLPNMSMLVFDSDEKLATFHPTTLMRCKQYGSNIRSMVLEDIEFSTPSEFCRVLSAFPNMSNLTCYAIGIQREGNNVHLDLWKQRLSQQLRLTTLEIIGWSIDNTALSLLFELGLPTVVELRLVDCPATPDLSQWTHLQSLTLQTSIHPSDIERSIEILRTLKPQSSSVVVLDLFCDDKTVTQLYMHISSDPIHQLLPELERILLTFPKVNLNFRHLAPFCIGKGHSWIEHFGKCFPKLSKIHPQCFAIPLPELSRDCQVSALAISPDGRWVATGSSDSVITLWDSNGAGVIHEWIAHSDKIRDLAFSPDSQYLASTSEDEEAAIWDPTQSSRRVARFYPEGHLGCYCTWSSDGALIATYSFGYPVQFWDVRHGFQKLREVDGASGGSVAHSNI